MDIRSLKYKNYTVRFEKNAMSTVSGKVYVLEGGVKVLPQGHYLTSDRVEYVFSRKRLGLENAL